MKKVVGAVVLLILLGGLFGLIFTKPGNDLLRSLVQQELSKRVPVPVKVEKLSLMPLDIALFIGKDSNITLRGDLNLFAQSFDIDYKIHIARLEELEPLTGQKLQGPLHTWGKVKGNIDRFKVQGRSDLAQSDTSYDVVIEDFNPKSVLATIKHASIAKLLYMVAQPRFASGKLDVDAKLSDLDPNNLKGDFVAKVAQGVVNTKVMDKAFGVTLPKTSFQGVAKAKLAGSKVHIVTDIDSNLLKVALKGALEPKRVATNLSYDIKIKELALLKPITKSDLRGALSTKGTIQGDRKKMFVQGITDVGGSKSDYKVVLRELQPKSVTAHIKEARLQKLLYMVAQPLYADGLVNSTIKLSELSPLSGSIETTITKGRTNARVLKKEFDFENANLTFNLTQKSTITKGLILSDIAIDSSVAKMVSNGAKFDIGSGKFDAKYRLDIPDLRKLYFATKQKMRGKLTITGEAKKDKDLVVTAHSDTLGGTFDMKMLNDDVDVKLKGIKVVELTDMLYYPRVFDSTMDAKLDYNIATKKGKLHAQAFDGHILPNQMTFLLKQMANFDITREIYKVTELNSTINDRVIISNLDMKSRLTHISSTNALLDAKKNIVNAKLRIDIQGRPLYVKIKGAINAPKVSLDAKELLKQRAKKEIQKKLGDKLPKEVKGLFNMF